MRLKKLLAEQGVFDKVVSQDQLVGDWYWCHDGETPIDDGVHQLTIEGRITIARYDWANGVWRMYDDGTVYVGRLQPDDRHIFKVIDINTLELIDPVRYPVTMMKRVE